MKTVSAILVAPYTYDFIEEEIPDCGPDDVILRMRSLGICHSDLPVYTGICAVSPNPRYHFREPSKPVYPARVGHEAVGEVIAAGSRVTRFREGDLVTGRMRYSQKTLLHVPNADIPAPTIQLFRIPETQKDALCCLGEPMECVINMIRETKPQFGDHVAVVGCGFMGLLTIAGLSRCGCESLVGVDLNESKLALAPKYGATQTINPARIDNLSEWAYDITNGNFFDAVIEVSGSIYGLDTALKILKYTHQDGNAVTTYLGHGRIISSSVYTAEEVVPPSLGFNLMTKGPVIHNVHPSYALNTLRNEEQGIAAFLSGVFPMEELVTTRTPFSDLSRAMSYLVDPPEDYVKGIVTFPEG